MAWLGMPVPELKFPEQALTASESTATSATGEIFML
jgi:hypothetical protein